jgi:hypothetical protein
MSDFEICFAVEVFGFDVARAVRVRGCENDNVGGDLVVGADEDKVPHSDVFPECGAEFGFLGG